MKLYSLYEFAPVSGDDDLDPDPVAAGPVLAGDVPIRHVYRSGRLIELMQEHDAATAFVVWARESLGMYDAAQAATADIGALEQARADVLRIVHEAATAAKGRAEVNSSNDLLMDAFRVYFDAGMTMRQIANHLGKPLSFVTMIVTHRRERVEMYADAEEALIAGMLRTTSLRDMAVQFQTTPKWLRRMAALHGIDTSRVPRQSEAA